MTMPDWKENKNIYAAYFIMLALAFSSLAILGKSGFHLWANQMHSPFWDTFFTYATHLGDGVFIVIVSAAMLLWNLRVALASLSSYIFSGIFVQLGKRLIWPDAPRPIRYFEEGALHLVEGIKMYHHHSFPSGHTTSAFALFFLLILFVKSQKLKALFLLLALITAISRVYLSQHFLADVAAGSIIGVFSAIAIYLKFSAFEQNWMNFSLIKKDAKH
jgi:membrane-associated phospholipid phosphatase